MPFADALYACDLGWWRTYLDDWAEFPGLKFTWHRTASIEFDLIHCPSANKPGLGKDCLHTGNNSGYQAVNLAYLLGAKRICLLGYDMQATYGRSHWHGDHRKLANPMAGSYKIWREKFARLYQDLVAEGVDVVNYSRETALTIPRAQL